MAHAWIRQEGSTGAWGVAVLNGSREVFFLTGKPARPLAKASRRRKAATYIRRYRDGVRAERWMLFAPAGAKVTVNGIALALGIRELRDKDEIRVGETEPMIFALQSPAQIEAFEGHTACSRCRDPISPGAPAVRCPGCGAWHHELPEEERPCWTYHGVCASCRTFPTSLDGGFPWTPEEL